MKPHLQHELTYWKNGYTVIGIDEVGRGCLAGPITVGAVCFSPEIHTKYDLLALGINDSKKLSSLARNSLSKTIKTISLVAHTASSPVEMINKKGIVFALLDAIGQVVLKCVSSLPDNKIILLIDGPTVPHIPYINTIERQGIIRGDSESISIAAASILAKVERDMHMEMLSQQHPFYRWHENKGYGTEKHRNAIKEFGSTTHHRTLFIRNVLKG